ncbi:hypothetical protein [Mucilaginibacter gotjawali]|uniref:Uncharacterized protein n=2 Tax=Mucilaginibacter gotjawali TaxID=1550579 RepID=A0A839SMC4_9SPHI|nr:hypothetical protein [Mucilaginibacter gotjawali]MBB3058722.1 hypothetical protein [Mucilaginibacter gotjawali]BAU55673.1 hypothetical protein MgSA37_03864 [Mucilaginibacter gotjawali]
MKKDKHLLPFEHILTAYASRTDQASAVSPEAEAAFVFQQAVDVQLPDEKATRMLDALTAELSKASLGSMVTQSVAVKQLTSPELQEKTGLTPSLIEAIQADRVFTNSVPVKSLVKLLKLLGLGIDSAMEAIQVTFDRLQTEARNMVMPSGSFQPSYRKGMIRGELGKDLSGIKSDESFLYQNEEALKNYTDRLTELYHTL